MFRILSLQKMEPGPELAWDDMAEGSTCSYALCGHCSSNSQDACAPPPFFVAI